MPDHLPLGPLLIDIEGVELTVADRARLCHPAIGGIVLFAHNYESAVQIRALIREIRGLRNPELLITVDQEGGRVQRFKTDFTLLPAAATYGALYRNQPDNACDLAQAAGYLMALELLQVGVDFSFAPVLDVASVESQVIGDRAFATDGNVVAELAGAFIVGMNKAGMRATGKHFPGHGGVVDDSHVCQPGDDRDWQPVSECDLIPYRRLVDQLDAVMTAHVAFNRIDSRLPTYSSFWLQQVLRKQLGFTGLIVSDDLAMAGAAEYPQPAERVNQAIAAGCDMVIFCNSLLAVDQMLPELTIEPVDAAVSRMLAMKSGHAHAALRQQAEAVLLELAPKS